MQAALVFTCDWHDREALAGQLLGSLLSEWPTRFDRFEGEIGRMVCDNVTCQPQGTAEAPRAVLEATFVPQATG